MELKGNIIQNESLSYYCVVVEEDVGLWMVIVVQLRLNVHFGAGAFFDYVDFPGTLQIPV